MGDGENDILEVAGRNASHAMDSGILQDSRTGLPVCQFDTSCSLIRWICSPSHFQNDSQATVLETSRMFCSMHNEFDMCSLFAVNGRQSTEVL